MVDIERFACAVYGDDDGQPDRGFSGGDDHYEENKNLSGQLMPVRREGDERQIHAIQHQLDRHEDGDDVALDQESAHAAGEEDAAQHEIVRNRDHLVLHLLCGRAARHGWLAGQDHGTHDGDQDQDRSNFKGQQEFVE